MDERYYSSIETTEEQVAQELMGAKQIFHYGVVWTCPKCDNKLTGGFAGATGRQVCQCGCSTEFDVYYDYEITVYERMPGELKKLFPDRVERIHIGFTED